MLRKKMNQFLLFSIFLSLLNPISNASSPLNAKITDTPKLLAFKSSLPNPNILSNWKETTDPCHFTGVLCNNSRVTSLNFTSLSLSTNFSSVSTHLFSIELLISISISSSNISGSLQPFTICSSSLTEIDLSHNFISGSLSNLSFFSSCSSLSSLNLSYNLLGSFSNDLKGVQFGFSLKRLDLSWNLLSGEQVLPWVLTHGCDKLSHLALKGNKLEGSFSLSKCSNLEYLDLSFNNFSIFMPNFENDCFNLKHLDLSSSKFVGKIESSFVGCSSLSFLNMSNNQLTGGLPNFPSSKSLEFLYLSNNKFEGSIPQSFADDVCSTLIELDLSFNNFSGMVPNAFKSCSLLENFDISNNNFSGKLPVDVLLKMGNLKKLSLGFNHFEGFLPDSFSLLSSLESLDLSSNSISGEIPPNICQNSDGKPSKLKELNLQHNLFTGHIPPTLGNCSQLVTLDLSSNYLSGSIPTSLGSLTQLKDLIMWMNKLEGDIPNELTYSRALENLILDFNDLTGTIPSGLKKCINLNCLSLSSNKLSGNIPSWIGTLSNLAILKLSNNSFYGEIPPEIGDCKSLLWLDLNSNSLTGIIPPTLTKQSGTVGLNVGKKFWYFRNNGGNGCQGTGILLEFSGIRQDAINRIPTRCKFEQIYLGHTKPNFDHNGSMIFLDLSYNNLQGSIPKELGSMFYLWILNLGHNNLSGQIPEELSGLQHIGIMYLSHNHLSGLIPPSLGTLSSLTDIDLSNNELSGAIPATAQLTSFPPSRFYNNSGLCGYPLPLCDEHPKTNSTDHHRKHGYSIAWSVAMGFLCSVFCIFGLIMVVLEVKKRKKRNESFHDIYTNGNSHSNSTSAWNYISRREALSISLATFENKPLRKLTYADLLEATNGFHEDTMIGKGGFGNVYKAQLKDGTVVAIKKLIHISGQGDREFIAEMETIGKIKHENLVPLLGYCKVREERLLVYEYMKYGSLDDVLHNPKKVGMNLNWGARRKIAIGAARGLAFLHHECDPHIIHRDMKSSNVLVDENLEARVSDFGMARLMSAMDTHLSVSSLAGTPGYVPPEYYHSFRCSTQGDVYSYGVVLLELLTGKQATDSSDFGDNNIVGWVKSHTKLKIRDVFDPILLKEDPTLEMELLQHLKIACACLDDRALRRPTMIQVLAMFEDLENGSSNTAIGAGCLSTRVEILDTSIEEVSESEGNYK